MIFLLFGKVKKGILQLYDFLIDNLSILYLMKKDHYREIFDPLGNDIFPFKKLINRKNFFFIQNHLCFEKRFQGNIFLESIKFYQKKGI